MPNIKYYLTPNRETAINQGAAKWLFNGDSFILAYVYNIESALSWDSIESLKKSINLKKDHCVDLKPAEFIDGKFNRLIDENEIWPDSKYKKSLNHQGNFI